MVIQAVLVLTQCPLTSYALRGFPVMGDFLPRLTWYFLGDHLRLGLPKQAFLRWAGEGEDDPVDDAGDAEREQERERGIQ